MKGSPLTQVEEGEYEVLADHVEGELVHLLMRRPTDPGNSIYYYALPRQQTSFRTDEGTKYRSVLVAEKEEEKMVYTIYCRLL